MPTTNIKCLIMFRDADGFGWSELHYQSTGTSNPSLAPYLTNLVDVLIPARAAISASEIKIVGARVSYPRPGAIAALSKKVFVACADDTIGTASSTSLAVQTVDPTNTKSKIIHLRGFFQSVEKNGEYQPSGSANAGWRAAFANWFAVLQGNSYGWLSTDPLVTIKGNVTGYTSNTDGTVTFTVAPTLNVLPITTPPSVVVARFARLNKSTSTLNKTLTCTVVDATHLRTIQPIATGPFFAQGVFTIRGTSFVRYSTVQNVDIGERREGRPLDRYPGRSKARPRY